MAVRHLVREGNFPCLADAQILKVGAGIKAVGAIRIDRDRTLAWRRKEVKTQTVAIDVVSREITGDGGAILGGIESAILGNGPVVDGRDLDGGIC